jgi:hypothetical protein
MTLEQLLTKANDGELLDIYCELNSCVVPATGYAHAYCRKVNKLIDEGKLCIRQDTYRKVYLPTLAKAVLKEMANRYANHCYNSKCDIHVTPLERNDEVTECAWCEEEFDNSDLRNTDIGMLCDNCIAAIRSRGEQVTVYD